MTLQGLNFTDILIPVALRSFLIQSDQAQLIKICFLGRRVILVHCLGHVLALDVGTVVNLFTAVFFAAVIATTTSFSMTTSATATTPVATAITLMAIITVIVTGLQLRYLAGFWHLLNVIIISLGNSIKVTNKFRPGHDICLHHI